MDNAKLKRTKDFNSLHAEKTLIREKNSIHFKSNNKKLNSINEK